MWGGAAGGRVISGGGTRVIVIGGHYCIILAGCTVTNHVHGRASLSVNVIVTVVLGAGCFISAVLTWRYLHVLLGIV
jgi:hypothetical protein